jgi:hypothetical protein
MHLCIRTDRWWRLIHNTAILPEDSLSVSKPKKARSFAEGRARDFPVQPSPDTPP